MNSYTQLILHPLVNHRFSNITPIGTRQLFRLNQLEDLADFMVLKGKQHKLVCQFRPQQASPHHIKLCITIKVYIIRSVPPILWFQICSQEKWIKKLVKMKVLSLHIIIIQHKGKFPPIKCLLFSILGIPNLHLKYKITTLISLNCKTSCRQLIWIALLICYIFLITAKM